MIPIIIMIISLLLDGILTNFLPFMVNDLSLYTPLFTVVSIFFLYPFYRKNNKKYWLIVFTLGIVYDLFYTNLLFLNAILFLGVAYVSKVIYKNYEVDFIKLIIYLVIIIVVYESMTGIIIFLYHLVPVTFEKVIYKISHSLLLNIIYGEIIYFLLKVVPKKYKKISIN